MATYVKTAELKKLLPKTLMLKEISALTGVDPKRIWSIRAGRTEFTDFYIADKIAVGLDRIADLYYLEEYESCHHRKHGMQAYNREGCRCSICVEAKKQSDARYNRSAKKKASNARYRAKLKANAERN